MSVAIDDAELLEMMEQLEADTAVAEPVAAAAADATAAPLPDDEMIAALEAQTPAPEPEPKPEPAPEPTPEPKAEAPATKPAQPAASYETATAEFVDPEQLKKDVRIDPTNLDTAMIEHASLYVHYAMQTVRARRQFDRVKNAFEILCAKLDAEHREDLAAGGKKVTETLVENSVKSDARWSAGQARVIEAQSNWRLAEIAENAFHQRKDLLLEIARDRRKEREGQLRVLEQQKERDRVAEMLAQHRQATA